LIGPGIRPVAPTRVPVMTIIVGAWRPSPTLKARVMQIKRLASDVPTEILVATGAPWPDSPRGVKVIATPSASRGDRYDAAGERARGRYLAFIDEWVTIGHDWQRRAIELLADPEVAAVGGPLICPASAPSKHRAAALILHSPFGIGPRRYLFRREAPKTVADLPTMNLVVKRDAFWAVGGFQSPTRFGDGSRLGYKIRTLLGKELLYHPDLAGYSPSPALPQPLISLTMRRGIHRGDIVRRMRETSPAFPYAIPAIALAAMIPLLLAAAVFGPARWLLAAVAAAYVVAGVSLLVGAGRDWRAGVRAAAWLPSVHLAFAFGFWRGFLGKSRADISPPRARQRNLRILVFNWRDVTHPWAGGAEQYIHEMATRWVKSGCEVGWVCARHGSARRREVMDGIQFWRVGGAFSLYPMAMLTYLFRLRRHYDVVVDCENGIPFFTPLYSRKPRVLVMYHVHQEVFRRELRPQLRWLALWLEGSLMPRAYAQSRVVAISASTRDALTTHGFDASQIEVIPCGVNLPETATAAHRSVTPSLLYLGRLKPYKSVDDLIASMPRILAAHPDTRLDIVGQGPDRKRLERLSWKLKLAGHVRFHGYLPARMRDQLLARAWVMVCPSAFEGWGIVCMEASARATPVIAADVPGLRDCVVDGTTGILVPHGDRGALAAAASDLIGDTRRRRRMGLAGRQWAANYSWDLTAESFLDILREMGIPTHSDPGVGTTEATGEQRITARAS
jgi:glycosyltransferase involved in cell wall biosynthesis